MTRITANWLTQPGTQRLFDLFHNAGHQLYCVGGCVRNALLGAPVADIDMSTDAHPEQILAVAKEHDLRAIPTGIDHGTVTLISGGTPFEITTFRSDLETDGRRATVAFSKSVSEDAKRRDFTINALYCAADGSISDPVAGLVDLEQRRVRFIGDPNARITEDYLRILRFFRFHAWYGSADAGIDADGLAACAAHGDGLGQLSRERIGGEMIKLLSAPDPAPAVASMAQSGILRRVMPGAEPALLPVLIHIEGETKPDWHRRVLALGGEELKDNWRLSKADARALQQGIEDLASETTVAELAYRHGPDHGRNIALLRAAFSQSPAPENLEPTLAAASAAQFPIKSADLAQSYQGPALGAKLRALEADWISSGFKLSKRQLLGK